MRKWKDNYIMLRDYQIEICEKVNEADGNAWVNDAEVTLHVERVG